MGTTEQNTAILENECKRVILRRPCLKYVGRYLCNAYAKHRFTKFFWKRNVLSYVEDKAQHYGTQINKVVGGGQFYGSDDNKSFNKIFIALFWAVICFGSVIRIWSRSMEELRYLQIIPTI